MKLRAGGSDARAQRKRQRLRNAVPDGGRLTHSRVLFGFSRPKTSDLGDIQFDRYGPMSLAAVFVLAAVLDDWT